MEGVSKDVLETLFSYLPPEQVVRNDVVCRKWYDVAHRANLWRFFLARQYPNAKPRRLPPREQFKCLSLLESRLLERPLALQEHQDYLQQGLLPRSEGIFYTRSEGLSPIEVRDLVTDQLAGQMQVPRGHIFVGLHADGKTVVGIFASEAGVRIGGQAIPIEGIDLHERPFALARGSQTLAIGSMRGIVHFIDLTTLEQRVIGVKGLALHQVAWAGSQLLAVGNGGLALIDPASKTVVAREKTAVKGKACVALDGREEAVAILHFNGQNGLIVRDAGDLTIVKKIKVTGFGTLSASRGREKLHTAILHQPRMLPESYTMVDIAEGKAEFLGEARAAQLLHLHSVPYLFHLSDRGRVTLTNLDTGNERAMELGFSAVAAKITIIAGHPFLIAEGLRQIAIYDLAPAVHGKRKN